MLELLVSVVVAQFMILETLYMHIIAILIMIIVATRSVLLDH